MNGKDVYEAVTGKPIGEARIDGQTVERWHSKEGEAARLKAIRIAEEDMGCWPPCRGDCCKRVRAFKASAEYTGEG